MSELIEYTPLRLPTMTSPAWPDNTRKELEADYTLPEKKVSVPAPAKKKKKRKASIAPTEPVEESVVQEEVQTTAPKQPTEPANTDSSFAYQVPREADLRSSYVENPVTLPCSAPALCGPLRGLRKFPKTKLSSDSLRAPLRAMAAPRLLS